MDLLGLLLPQRCAVCALPAVPLCGPCRDGLRRLIGPLCARCGAPTVWPVERCRECSGRRLAFASARAAIVYDRSARLFVTAWKERGLRTLAAAAAELVTETIPRPDGTLTFVPPDGNRTLERGHHPAEWLARALGENWELPVAALLERRGSARQRGLSLAERRRNVAGVFRPAGEAPKHVVLVDDVYTSGSTAAAAASALRKAGARSVHVITFARAVRGSA